MSISVQPRTGFCRTPQFAGTWLPPRTVDTLGSESRDVICRTYHFRAPSMFQALPPLLEEKFLQGSPKKAPIPVAIYAGADGSDARSLFQLLTLQLGEREVKRFQIESIDIDPAMVEKAHQPITQLSHMERKLLHKKFKVPLGQGEGEDLKKRQMRPLLPGVTHKTSGDVPYLVGESMSRRLKPRLGDFFEEAKKPMKARVIMARNVWDHFSPGQQKVLAHNLYRNMPKNSVLVIGSESVDIGVRELLKKAGFKQLSVEGPKSAIFEKP